MRDFDRKLRVLVCLATAFVLACTVRCDTDARAQVNGGGGGLFAPSLATVPLNVAVIMDSIGADYLGTTPPVRGTTYGPPLSATQTGFGSVAAYTLQQQGRVVYFTDYAIPGTAIWQWRSNTGNFAIPSPSAGKQNVAVIEGGTNDFFVSSTAPGGLGSSAWTANYAYTGIAYVIASVSGTPTIFHTLAGGTSGSGTPSWTASGNVPDGSVTWVAISLSQLYADMQTNMLALTAAYAAAGWSVIATPILPICESPTSPQTLANMWTQTQTWATWLVGEIGSSGISAVQRWNQDTTMWTPGYPTACSNTTYYHTDGVHPTDAGHALLATWMVAAANAL